MKGLLESAARNLGPGLLRASGALSRVRWLHAEREAETLERYGSLIYAFWHGRMWLLAARLRDRRSAVLVSLSRDGEILAGVLAGLGFHPVRGSTSRGGAGGLRELEAQLQQGRSVAVTPDGPRGPSRRAQPGAVALAGRTGKPILPLGAGSRHGWHLSSWDAFQIPRPGSRAAIVFGEPLLVPPGADTEPWRLRLEASLNAVETEADDEARR
jgi:lysophospholipid acyltransferase (LPLAT)-like uncharacterized protein